MDDGTELVEAYGEFTAEDKSSCADYLFKFIVIGM
jgi:hypothetical protein